MRLPTKTLKKMGLAPAKAHKYGARGFYDEAGEYWHSKREYSHGLLLKSLERDGLIRDLKRGKQARYRLEINGVLIGTYTPDFVYTDLRTNATVVCDVKGYVTKEYKRTKKLMKAIHGVDITEVR